MDFGRWRGVMFRMRSMIFAPIVKQPIPPLWEIESFQSLMQDI